MCSASSSNLRGLLPGELLDVIRQTDRCVYYTDALHDASTANSPRYIWIVFGRVPEFIRVRRCDLFSPLRLPYGIHATTLPPFKTRASLMARNSRAKSFACGGERLSGRDEDVEHFP